MTKQDIINEANAMEELAIRIFNYKDYYKLDTSVLPAMRDEHLVIRQRLLSEDMQLGIHYVGLWDQASPNLLTPDNFQLAKPLNEDRCHRLYYALTGAARGLVRGWNYANNEEDWI